MAVQEECPGALRRFVLTAVAAVAGAGILVAANGGAALAADNKTHPLGAIVNYGNGSYFSLDKDIAINGALLNANKGCPMGKPNTIISTSAKPYRNGWMGYATVRCGG